MKKFFRHHQIFLSKNIPKLALKHFFNEFIEFNRVYYLQLNFKLKIDPKLCDFKKNLEEIMKTWKKFVKKFLQPCDLK